MPHHLIRFVHIAWLSVLACVAPVPGQEAPVPAAPAFQWREARSLRVEGRGWTNTRHAYDRLPAYAESEVRRAVWQLSENSAGLAVRFVTSATTLAVRWQLRASSLALPHMPATGVSGVDLYVHASGAWHWLALGIPRKYPENEQVLSSNLAPGKREYLLYLPLYNGVDSVLIGVPAGDSLAPPPAMPIAQRLPMVFYGTSIVQGGVASRPGMAYPALLQRRLEWPAVNLGFSGNGTLDEEMAPLLAEIAAAVYVLDCLPNLSSAEVASRTERFVHRLRALRPHTPIVLVENLQYPGARWRPEQAHLLQEKNQALRRAYRQLQQEGLPNLHYLHSESLLGTDGEATVDGVHPNDLGFLRIAEAMTPLLQQLLRTGK